MPRRMSSISRAFRSVYSSDAPSGVSNETWNSPLSESGMKPPPMNGMSMNAATSDATARASVVLRRLSAQPIAPR